MIKNMHAALTVIAILAMGVAQTSGVPPAQASQPALLVVPGRSVGPIVIGMDATRAAHLLGPADDQGADRLSWPDHGLTARTDRHGRITAIFVDSPLHRTRRDIGIGSTRDQVRAVYGPAPATERGRTTLTYRWSGITFVFRGDRVVMLAVHPPGISPRAAAWTVTAAMARQLPARVVRWLDGDTLIAIRGAERTQVRLIGIDAPEADPGARAARQARDLGRTIADITALGALATMTAESMAPPRSAIYLELDVRTHDRFGRLLAYIWRDGFMVNEKMLRQGFALVHTVPPNVRYADRFLRAQREARTERRGLWGLP
jgi:micrococcal nuclease